MPSTSKVLKVTSTKFSTAPTSKRMWDRVHCCLYCEKVVPKIARHLQTHHAGEALVVKALLLPKKSSARNAVFEDIRKKGDYAYNSKVIKEGMGELLVYKRPKVGTMGPADYLPCPHCHGYFVKTALWRHESNCTAKKTSESPKLSNCQMAGGALLPTKEPCSSKLQTILASMRSDGIVLTIRGMSGFASMESTM
ncbi:hypothetical protein BSL78_30299 [Apostichopus japonicus]|uniref:Uncharacterized protein n=1 Tax=Stichopus japonicus TaxID=307972 RepID=A0A2G8JAX9_STIJA|nr:hypothetical protein BSL78_30299 [Apostichopus japonicus]